MLLPLLCDNWIPPCLLCSFCNNDSICTPECLWEVQWSSVFRLLTREKRGFLLWVSKVQGRWSLTLLGNRIYSIYSHFHTCLFRESLLLLGKCYGELLKLFSVAFSEAQPYIYIARDKGSHKCYGNSLTITVFLIPRFLIPLQGKSPIASTQWLRVVLDEGHVIRNPNAMMSKAVHALKSERRWVVTGTPIQNSMKDMFSVISFLKLEPFTDRQWWRRTMERPISEGDQSALRYGKIISVWEILRGTVYLLSTSFFYCDTICHLSSLPCERFSSNWRNLRVPLAKFGAVFLWLL